MLRPEHLRTLQAVIQRGSFAAAANRLGYTASAVSQQMAALERETGARLFQRSARSVLPTEAAEVMNRHAVGVLAAVDRLVAAVDEADRHTARKVRLGVFPSFGSAVLARVLERRDPHRRAAIRLSVAEPSQLIRGLVAGGDLDAAIVYQVGQAGLSWPSMVTRRWIAEDRFKVVFPAGWRHLPPPPYPADQLVDLPWIMHHPGSSDAVTFDSLFARWDLRPRVVCHSDDFTATLSLVAAGLGAALVPTLALDAFPSGIVVADIPWFNISRSIFALVGPGRDSPVLTRLIDDLIVEVATAVPPNDKDSSPDLPCAESSQEAQRSR